MLTILDVNDRWHAQTEDARRYQAEKLKFFASASNVRHVVIQPDTGTWTHTHGRSVIEHVGSARGRISGRRLRELVQLHRPDVIECGSPTLLPVLVQIAAARLSRRPALLGHSHGGGFTLESVVGRGLESWWTTQAQAQLDAIVVPTRDEALRRWAEGLDRVYLSPLGVDLERFGSITPDSGLVERLRAGVADRAIVWIDWIDWIAADVERIERIYAELCRRSSHDPALILAGDDDDDDDARERFAAAHRHVHAPALVDPDTRARWLGAAEVAVILAGGAVAAGEAMAAGKPIVARSGSRASALIREASCGVVVVGDDPLEVATATLGSRDRAGEEQAKLADRGRTWIARFDWASTFERLLVVYAEVLSHVRAGERVPVGIHERMLPAALARPPSYRK